MTPLSGTATDLLELHVPLPLVEASHFIGSVAGFAMLVIARIVESPGCRVVGGVPARAHRGGARDAQRHRGRSARTTVLAFLLLASRHHFERRSSLFSQALNGAWIPSIGRGGRRIDPVLRLSRRRRPRAVVGIRVRRKRAARRAQ